MSRPSPSWVTPLTLAALTLLLPCTLGCTPLEGAPRTAVEKTYHFPIVLCGVVREKTPDPRFSYGSESSAFTVDFEVHCIIKGDGDIADRIDIQEGGTVPGLCHSTEFDVGSMYIVFIRRMDDGVYKFAETQLPGDDANLNEVAKACGLNPRFPVPSDGGAANGHCPQPANSHDCIHDMHDEHGHDHPHSDSMDHADHEGHDAHEGHEDHHEHEGHEDHEGHDDHVGHDHGDEAMAEKSSGATDSTLTARFVIGLFLCLVVCYLGY